MSILSRLSKYIIVAGWRLHADHLLSDKAFNSLYYRWKFDRRLNWDNPRTYNEKLHWLKLHDRQPIYCTLVDKAEVKAHVESIIGEEYLIPTLGVWERWEDIDFSRLPEKFVLKCTHDSGGTFIVTDRSAVDLSRCPEVLARSMKRNFFWESREWPYRSLKHRIIAEPYLVDEATGELTDYKFFCFDGVCKAMFVATDRQSGHTKFDFYDRDFNHLDMHDNHDNAAVTPAKPKNYEKMVELAETMAQGFPHVRMDFYNIDGKIYFGEYTFYHWSGFDHFYPEKWEYTFGDWIDLEKVKK